MHVTSVTLGLKFSKIRNHCIVRKHGVQGFVNSKCPDNYPSSISHPNRLMNRLRSHLDSLQPMAQRCEHFARLVAGFIVSSLWRDLSCAASNVPTASSAYRKVCTQRVCLPSEFVGELPCDLL